MLGSITHKVVGNKIRYYVVIDLPKVNGKKRNQKWIPAGTSKKAAEELLSEVRHQYKYRKNLIGQKIPFEQLSVAYLQKNQRRLASSTYKRYESIINDLNSFFGSLPASEIEPFLTEQYFDTLIARDLSQASILKHRTVMKQVFCYMKELKIINYIPMTQLTAYGKDNNHAFQTWNADEIKDFCDQIYGTPLYMPVYLAAHTGMRLGEVLALKWSEIDFTNKQLTVRYAVDDKGNLKVPKTKSSRRPIMLTDTMIKALHAQKIDQKKNRMKFGKEYFKNDFVCTFANGKPLTRNYVSVTFRRKVKQLKFTPIRFHDLRHSFATLALANNVPAKVIQEILGHSKISTTLDIYSHVIPSMQSSTVKILDQIFNF